MDFQRKYARIQVSMPPELLSDVDEFASSHFLSRSGLICLSVSQYINASRMGEAMEQIYKLLEKMAAEKGTDEDKAQLDKIHDMLKLMRPDTVL